MVVDTVMIQVQDSDASVYWLLLRHDNIHTVVKSTKPCKSEQNSHTSQHNTTAQRKKHLTFWAAQSSLIWLNVLHEPYVLFFFYSCWSFWQKTPQKFSSNTLSSAAHWNTDKAEGGSRPISDCTDTNGEKVFIQDNYPLMHQHMIKVYYLNLYFKSQCVLMCFSLHVLFCQWVLDFGWKLYDLQQSDVTSLCVSLMWHVWPTVRNSCACFCFTGE